MMTKFLQIDRVIYIPQNVYLMEPSQIIILRILLTLIERLLFMPVLPHTARLVDDFFVS